ncbi:MAG: ATPase protein [Acidobacteria bacterium]|nr:ATPase protein [Acidobacteriota bacterium]
MIRRAITSKLHDSARSYPVVTVTGPRQSGKTTLVRAEFSAYDYVSLELPDQRSFALEDPRGFLAQFRGPVVLDEAQRAPELFSYIQSIVDEAGKPGQFILTGSQNFLLLQSVSQSLAGRCAVLHLLPFSLSELSNRPAPALEELGRDLYSSLQSPRLGLMETLFTGFYPRIHDKRLPPRDWLANYYQTYLERDVRSVINIGDLEAFGRFVRLCAGRTGQLLNLSGLAADCGVTHTTAKRWISVLEASFLVLLLRPYHANYGKRLIKSPKLYFLDTGLLSFLLRIQTPEDLQSHAARGAVFESYVISELHKNFSNRGERPGIYFWRDSGGHEVDFVIEAGRNQILVEAKSAQTLASDFFEGLHYVRRISKQLQRPAALIYGGDQSYFREHVAVYPWFAL